MKKLFTLLTAALMAATTQAQNIFKITDFGASPSANIFTNASAIQQAINVCSSAGGGTVLVDSGNFSTTTFILKSNVTLRINPGASLTAPALNSDYPEYPYNQPSWSDNHYTKRSLIFAQESNNIRITGGGTIYFNGLSGNFLSVQKNFRPFGIRMHRCKNIRIDSISFRTAPHWMVHLFDCDTIYISRLNIFNHGFGSNDGINIDGCRNVLIEDCDIDSNDDPIVVKTHSPAPAEHILVRNCTVATYERAVKVGNESCGPMRNIRFQNIMVNKSAFYLSLTPANAIYVAVADGGLAENIVFENIQVNTPYETPIFIRLNNRGNKYTAGIPDPPVQYLRNVTIKNFICTAQRAIPSSITAIPGYYVENITLENVNLTLKGYSGILGNSAVPELEKNRPEPDMWGDSLPSHAFFIRHAKNIQFKNVCFEVMGKDLRPAFFFEDTSGIDIKSCVRPYTSIPEKLLSSTIHIRQISANFYEVTNNHPAVFPQVILLNTQGNVLFKQRPNVNEGKVILDLNQFPSGLYFLHVESGQESTVKKIFRY
ncbi:MAG: glycosyl hydrolase family 28 protein [Chitinophagales bacterium]|nr:glycosyl hydrolase family 28 protein [Chitinophagales bacterium]